MPREMDPGDAASDVRTKELLDACKAAVRQVMPDADVVLFGSRARGTGALDSDYDLLVLCDVHVTPALRRRVRDTLYDTALAHDAVVTALVYSRSRWNSPLWRASPLHERVEAEGVFV